MASNVNYRGPADLPDTIPVIGPSAKTRGLWYATGHGHLGLTYAATTSRLIARTARPSAPAAPATTSNRPGFTRSR